MGLLSTAAKVAVASSVHGRVQRRQQARWAAQDQQAQAAAVQQPLAPPPAAAPAVDPMQAQLDLLRQLGELRAAGVLTEAEFEAKKTAILGGQ